MTVIVASIRVTLLKLLRDRRAFILMLVMPIALTAILSLAFKNLFSTDSTPKFHLVIVSQSSGPVANQLIQTFESIPSVTVTVDQSQTQAEQALKSKKADVLLNIPKNIAQQMSEGHVSTLQIEHSSQNGIDASIVQSVVDQFGQQAALHTLAQSHHTKLITPTIHTSSSGLHAIGSGEYYAMGMLVLFLLSDGLGRAGVLLRDRKTDMFKRFLASPASRTAMTIGQWLAICVVLFGEGVIYLAADRLLLHVQLGSWWQDGLLVAAYAIGLSGIAIFLGSIVSQPGILDAMTGIGSQIASILGGSTIPIYIFPHGLQVVGRALPNGQILNGLLNSVSGIAISMLVIPIIYLLLLGACTALLARLRMWRLAE